MLKKQKMNQSLRQHFPCLAFAALCMTVGAGLSSAYHHTSTCRKRLAETNTEKLRSNLLRALSHDLRTPLSGIMGNCLVFLENHALLGDEEKKEIVTNIYRESDWLINMVENLLIITRIKDDDLSINTNKELVEEVIGEALQKIEKRYPDHKINVKIPDNFIMLPMDATLIEQVAINLLENAILHSNSTEPLDIIIEDGPKEVSFTIRDYGIGIPADMLDDPFCGSPAYMSDAHKGMGIGLAICEAIIHAHHGTIKGRNHSNGAEFIFTLPKETQQQNSRKDKRNIKKRK